MPDDRHLRLGRLGGETLKTADSLARECADRFRQLRRGCGDRVILLRIHSNDARGFRRAIAADERPAEGERNFAEDLARGAPADRALDAIDPLGYLDLARDHRKEGTLFAFVNRILARGELHVRGSLRKVLELDDRQLREDRYARKFFDGQHHFPTRRRPPGMTQYRGS